VPLDLAPPGDAPIRARFTGSMPAYRRLMIRGALLQLVTLGIYRFWLLTDMRRFEWANTEVGGESAEYTGTAIELLLGFLIAIAVLVPLFVMIALAGLGLGTIGQFSGLLGYLLLGVLGQYAYFRARRFRLTRTVFRGIRLHQTGSAWGYAGRAFMWWIAITLTLGLAYPFAQASLERYKLRATFYGDLQGKFVGTSASLFWRGLVLWLIAVAPTVLMCAVAALLVDWPSLIAALGADDNKALESNESFQLALGLLGIAFGWFILALMVLFPAFQAIMLRWWLNGLRFGDVAVSSNLRTGQVYGAYLRYLGWSALITFGVLFGIMVVAIVVGGIVWAVAKGAHVDIDKDTGGVLAAIGGVIMYMVIAFAMWIVYQVAVKLRLWRITVDSVEIHGFASVERVRADLSQPSSAVGEGLVDALGAGGM
jgi:uncharacterized membrane protein YjgN (DUF898 family)